MPNEMTSISITKELQEKLLNQKLKLSAKMSKDLTWDEFFEEVIK